MRPAEEIEDIVGKADCKAPDAMRRRLWKDIAETLNQSQITTQKRGDVRVWRILMNSKIARPAIAAAVIVAVLIGVHQFGRSAPAFADVVQPLLTARTATYRTTINLEGWPPQTRECMFMEPGRNREVLASGVIRISDKPNGREMRLFPAERKAVIYETTDIPEEKRTSTNWFEKIRECIRQAQQTEDKSVTFLGKQKINGARAFGYRIVNNANVTDMTVWVDAQTLLPTWIEYSLDTASAIMMAKGTVILSDIVFNKQLDESLFSIQVPEGYERQTLQYEHQPFKLVGEEDLIQALRLWTDKSDGPFPSELNMNAAGVLIQLIKEEMGLTFEKGEAPDLSDPSLHEFYRIERRIQRGIGFVQRLSSKSDWHYAGKGVQPGNANTVIFWYRPEGSKTYRAIYGDLEVQDVLPEDLPK